MAFFFAMGSCEYLKVTGERRTDALRVRNFVFRKNQRIMDHSDPNLECADTVTLTFEFQKRDQRDDAVTQSKTKDPILCPVKAAAALIQRLRAEGATPDTHIYRYKDNRGRMKDLTSTVGLAILRDFVKNVDKSYGSPAGKVGLHSLRSSAAMAIIRKQDIVESTLPHGFFLDSIWPLFLYYNPGIVQWTFGFYLDSM